MATSCDSCGHRDNEVKSGGGIEPKARKITLLISNSEDMSRDILKVTVFNFLSFPSRTVVIKNKEMSKYIAGVFDMFLFNFV